MKRKKVKRGYLIAIVNCSGCQAFNLDNSGVWQRQATKDFYELKDVAIEKVQELHEQNKATACNGKLTIGFMPAVQEI